MIPLGSVLLRGELRKYAQKKKKKKKKNQVLKILRAALYSTSVSMPLICT